MILSHPTLKRRIKVCKQMMLPCCFLQTQWIHLKMFSPSHIWCGNEYPSFESDHVACHVGIWLFFLQVYCYIIVFFWFWIIGLLATWSISSTINMIHAWVKIEPWKCGFQVFILSKEKIWFFPPLFFLCSWWCDFPLLVFEIYIMTLVSNVATKPERCFFWSVILNSDIYFATKRRVPLLWQH